jgi:hypothetical protein
MNIKGSNFIRATSKSRDVCSSIGTLQRSSTIIFANHEPLQSIGYLKTKIRMQTLGKYPFLTVRLSSPIIIFCPI